MATEWKSQQSEGKYGLQFETDNEEKYKLVKKAAQMAVDGKTTADIAEVKHGEWVVKTELKTPLSHAYIRKEIIYICPYCKKAFRQKMNYCGNCGAKMDGKDGERG